MVESFLVRLGVSQPDSSKLVRIKDELFDVPRALQDVMRSIPASPVYSGEVVLREGRIPVPGLSFLQSLGTQSLRKVWVSKKGEWLFICGRNVLPGSITKTAGDINEKDAVVVLNQHGECIGYGEYTARQVTRWFDIGDMLRREKDHKAVAARFSGRSTSRQRAGVRSRVQR